MKDRPLSGPHFLKTGEFDQLVEALQLCAAEEPELPKIAAIAEAVGPLSQAILQAANATSLGVRRVTDLKHAVALVGPFRTKELIERLLARARTRSA